MQETLVNVSSFSILISGVIALIRFKSIEKKYYYFIILLWIGGLNELISYVIVKTGHTTMINSNAYDLVESILLLCFFKKIGRFSNRATLFKIVFGIFICAWITNLFFLDPRSPFGLYYNTFYAFVIVLLSISTINFLLVRDNENILKNGLFLIVMGLILYFTYRILVNAYWLYGLTKSRDFLLKILVIALYVNLISNLIYALAILWLPRKQQFMPLF